MKQQRRIAGWLILGWLIFMVCMTACHSIKVVPGDWVQYRVAFYQTDVSDEARAFKQEVEKYLHNYRVTDSPDLETLFVYFSTQNPPALNEAVDFFKKKPLQAIIIGLGEVDQLKPIAIEAMEQDIDVFTIHPSLCDLNGIYCIHTSPMAQAKLVASALKKDRRFYVEDTLWLFQEPAVPETATLWEEVLYQLFPDQETASLRTMYLPVDEAVVQTQLAPHYQKQAAFHHPLVIMDETLVQPVVNALELDDSMVPVYAIGNHKTTLEAVMTFELTGVITQSMGGKQTLFHLTRLLDGKAVPSEIQIEPQFVTRATVYDFYSLLNP
jgi:ABC-type sugar transport system substrate-binding protein